MDTKPEPTDAKGVYKAIIDELVDDTHQGVGERLIVEEGIWSNAKDQDDGNRLVRSLSDDQRKTLAQMINQARIGAIHDILANLTWWFECRDVGMTFRGDPMPYELSGMGLHGDFIGRLDGWKWPEEDANEVTSASSGRPPAAADA